MVDISQFSVCNEMIANLIQKNKLEGKELGPWRFRPFYANQSSELNFPIFLGRNGPNSEERGIHANPS